jgi:hypothetical protein
VVDLNAAHATKKLISILNWRILMGIFIIMLLSQ